jgi:hypothetical protein
MKQYRLIKEYPGSPGLNTIVEKIKNSGSSFYKIENANTAVPDYHVENNPEFWEEVVEKDYEILSYIKKGSTTCTTTKRRGGENHEEFWNIHSVKRLSDGEVFTIGDLIKTPYTESARILKFKNPPANEYCIQISTGFTRLLSLEKIVEKDYEILKTCPIEGTIYSVKRLSDGEVFTVGDRIKVYQHGSTKTIDSIDLYGNTSSMKEGIWFTYSTGSCHMTHIIKQKNLVYLTLNEQDIFEGDIVWYVNKENFYHDYIKAYPEVKFNSEIRAYFLTEEEAKKYIIENKPALSINEFWEITWMPTSGFNKHTYMKNLVKERLNLK